MTISRWTTLTNVARRLTDYMYLVESTFIFTFVVWKKVVETQLVQVLS